MVVAAVFNYLVFFGRDILHDMRHRHRRMQFRSRDDRQGKGLKGRKMAHTCHVCGLSAADSPRTAFRYCSECGGDYCYCPDHIQQPRARAGRAAQEEASRNDDATPPIAVPTRGGRSDSISRSVRSVAPSCDRTRA